MSPEQKMWTAIIEHAYLEATSEVNFFNPRRRLNQSDERFAARIGEARTAYKRSVAGKEKAQRWFSSARFEYICSLIGVEPDWFREQMKVKEQAA